MTTKKVVPDYDESTETYGQDPDADADETPLVSQLREEETGDKPVHQTSRVPKQGLQVHKPTPRQVHDAYLFKYDAIRKPRKKELLK